MFSEKQRSMKFNKDLCYTQNSNATKTEWELLKRRGEKKLENKRKTVDRMLYRRGRDDTVDIRSY